MNGLPLRTVSPLRVLPISIVAAVLAFSFALATSMPIEVASRGVLQAASRGTGEGLRYTNPFLLAGTDPLFFPNGGKIDDDPKGYELGDAVPSGTLVRYINATGGFLPYVFTAQALVDPRIGSGVNVFQPPLHLPFGRLEARMPSGNIGSAVRFDVTLSDLISTQLVGRFWLNIVNYPPESAFRFAISRMPTGQQYRTYFTNIQTVNAPGSVSYQIAANSVVVGTQVYTRLEDVGLTLASDGTLFGRLVKNQNVNFAVLAMSNGRAALSRNGQQALQTLSIPVEKGAPITSELVATACSVRASNAGTTPDKDAFAFKGYLDPKGETTATLAGTDFTLWLGNLRYTARFNAKGRAQAAFGTGKSKSKGLKVSYSPKTGALNITLQGVSLAPTLRGNTQFATNTYQTMVVGVEINSFRACEALGMETTVGTTNMKMAFVIGKQGFSRAGACQVLNVFGLDGSTPDKKTPATAWSARVMGIPAQDTGTVATTTKGSTKSRFPAPAAVATVYAAKDISVGIGGNTKSVSGEAKGNGKVNFNGNRHKDPYQRISLDSRHFVHTIQTNGLTPDETGIARAIDSTQPTMFPFGLSFKGYVGEAGRVIAPKGGSWKAQ